VSRTNRPCFPLPSVQFCRFHDIAAVCLARESVLTLSTDVNRLAEEIHLVSPNYFLNVPTLLERVRRGVEEAIGKRPAIIRLLFARARVAWQRQHVGRGRALDALWLVFGRGLIFERFESASARTCAL